MKTCMVIPEDVKTILSCLREANHEAYAVGGCVRDTLLSREPEDWDITTSAMPDEVKCLFRRTIDTGIQHGTVTVMVGKTGYEVTTYRVDGEYEDHRHPTQVSFTRSLKEDLMRRDFTINAMAYNEQEGIVDIFGGRQDLDAHVIRAVGNPRERFNEDALRMLRAVRFAAQLDFVVEEETVRGICEIAPTLSCVSQERIRVELIKLLLSQGIERLHDARKWGLSKVFLPEWDALFGVQQNNPHHYLDVGMHTMKVMQNIKQIIKREGVCDKKEQTVLMCSALFHDIAKPLCKSTDEQGVDHFYGHDEKGSELCRKIMRRLTFDNDTIDRTSRLVRAHDNRYQGGKKGVRRAVSRVGKDIFPMLFMLQEADVKGQSDYMQEEKLARLAQAHQMFDEVIQADEATTIKELKVNGSDLMKLGVAPGPEIGELLRELLELVLEKPEQNDKKMLLGIAKNLAKHRHLI